jgi:choline dehydrogenase-like flavoprotein
VSAEDARRLPPDTRLDADICVVGAGAAGISLALELEKLGRNVLLLESGDEQLDAQVQALHDLESTGYPLREDYMSRARYFGGSCNLWAGRSMRLDPLDFERRDWVAGSGWPISYEEVSRYYARAAQVLDLPDIDALDSSASPASLSAAERRLLAGKGLRSTVSVWARTPQRFGRPFLQRLGASPRVRLLLNASATSLDLDEAGTSITQLNAATLPGNRFTVRARQYVLASGGLENARLLLSSRNHAPAGVGNDHDQVGRCFMDHPRTVFGKVTVPADVRLKSFRGLPVRAGRLQIGIGASAEWQREHGLLNHYVTLEEETSGYAQARYQAMVQTAKVLMRRGHAGSRWDFRKMGLRQVPEMIYLLSPKEILPHWMYRGLHMAREALPRPRRERRYILVYFCEQPPDPASRVTLSNQRDPLGMPRLVLNWHIPDSVRQGVLGLQGLLQQQMQQTGFGQLEPGQGEMFYTDASHHMGTTRMSRDPAQGVVDMDCRVHGVRNLYAAGSSVFPCAGFANPTLTIVALSLRLAAHLSR